MKHSTYTHGEGGILLNHFGQRSVHERLPFHLEVHGTVLASESDLMREKLPNLVFWTLVSQQKARAEASAIYTNQENRKNR